MMHNIQQSFGALANQAHMLQQELGTMRNVLAAIVQRVIELENQRNTGSGGDGGAAVQRADATSVDVHDVVKKHVDAAVADLRKEMARRELLLEATVMEKAEKTAARIVLSKDRDAETPAPPDRTRRRAKAEKGGVLDATPPPEPAQTTESAAA